MWRGLSGCRAETRLGAAPRLVSALRPRYNANSSPPCERGGIGRRTGFRFQRLTAMWVRPPPFAPPHPEALSIIDNSCHPSYLVGMNVNLGATFDKFIAELLQTGLYQSQS